MDLIVVLLMVIAAIELPAIFAWAMSAIGLTMSGRGTRQRYVASTLERLARWPMIIARCVAIGAYVWLESWGSMCFTVVGLTFAIWFIHTHAGDEDDFWTGRGQQLKRWLADRLAPRPAAAIA